ncbi:hypothetical protein F2Q68_00029682 [Brassica cretica]|uniref:Transmembrane protein n=1 Tax=Brassica cretica TaxID=69181 RepID=A0A8S9GHH8_BRACR|nr:hypothetical protein F2Q68_00029682 [Brassica cretica]
MFRRNSVGNGRRNSGDFKFLVFVGNWSSLVVIDVVFLVAGLPSIVSARLGSQDLVFGDLTSMFFFHNSRMDPRLFMVSSLSFGFSVWLASILPHSGCLYSSHASLGVGVRSYSFGALVSSIQSFVVLRCHGRLVCGATLLELWFLLFRVLWFFAVMGALYVLV